MHLCFIYIVFIIACGSDSFRFTPKISHIRGIDIFNPIHASNRNKLLRMTSSEAYINRPLLTGKWSHFLCLTSPSISDILPHIHELRLGVDAWEIRADLLHDQSPQSVESQIILLKMHSNLPIIFTVRTKAQLGNFPDDRPDQVQSLLRAALRAGVQYLDVEASLPMEYINNICSEVKRSYPDTKLIGSYHTIESPRGKEHLRSMFSLCDLGGQADVLKLVTGASRDADCELIHSVGGEQTKPYIGVCLGEKGSHARLLNRLLTPVTHSLLSAAAPGQLTAKQLMDARQTVGLIKPKRFLLFGSPIAHSLSPAMHNTAFQTLLLPHEYSLCESSDVNSYRNIMNGESFGGASVTIPHKETIIPLLDEVRGAAVEIGAVNTVVVEEVEGPGADRRLVGYNTDWLGLYNPIKRLLDVRRDREVPAVSSGSSSGVGLVIGAGGTSRAACYAIKRLGLDLIVTNRSPDKSRTLAARFGGRSLPIDEVGSSIDPATLKVVISTLPADANFSLPTALLMNKPILFDVLYKPARTAFTQQGLDSGCECLQGATMLLEQGIAQFELWTERVAPRDEMKIPVFKYVDGAL